MNKDLGKAIERVCEVVMFENWLRFYFIEEAGEDDLIISVSEKSIEQIRKGHPTLVGLAERLNGQVIDHQQSVAAICLFVAAEIDGISYSEQIINRVFDSKDFQVSMQVFSTWVQSHEEQLDATFMEFGTWKKMFAEWLGTDKVKKYHQEVESRFLNTTTSPSGTMQ